MNKTALKLAAAVLTAAALSPAGGQSLSPEPDLASAGRNFALRVCSACHVVGPDQHFAPILKHPAPSFVSIAGRPQVTADSLRDFINSRHQDIAEPGEMPNPSLLDYQVDQVVAYIISLKPAASGPAHPGPASPTQTRRRRAPS
jgi:mono/diheme cytochrome c family protein